MVKLSQLYINFIKENKKYFIIYALTLVYIPINRIIIPKYYGELISSLKSKKFKYVHKIFLLLLGGWFFIQIMNTISSYIMTYLMPKFKQYIRNFLINEIMDSYKTNYEELKLGEIITKIIKTPYILEEVFYMFKDIIIKNFFIIISIFFYMFYYNVKLGLVFGGFMILLIMLSIYYVSNCRNNIRDIEVFYDLTHEEIEDTFSNLLSIYTARKYNDEKDRISNIDDKLYKNVQNMNKCRNKYRIIYTVLFIIIIIYLNYLGYQLFLSKKITLETFIAIFIINYSLLGIFMGLFQEVNEFMWTTTNINLILTYLTKVLPKKLDEKYNKNKITNKYTNGLDIKVKNVSFRYNKQSPYVLKNVNLNIKPNENIIIKGDIGSGKSTLSKLILRLLVNYEGDILINGVSNHTINIEDLRGNIMYIPQHPNLFNRTLYDNLMYGIDDKKITIKMILDKLVSVGLLDIKNKFEKIMKQKVGKLGHQLSGGQRQIVWILRSIFSYSKMVILDEPTSSLDASSKQKIMKLIEDLSKTRNLIIITHDKEVVEYNIHNKLVVFKNGKIEKIVKNMVYL